MQTKQAVENYFKGGVLWCTKCHRPLTPETTWLPDDTHDGRIFCYDCAPDDAIRAKDIS